MESRWGNTGGVLLLLLVAAISSGHCLQCYCHYDSEIENIDKCTANHTCTSSQQCFHQVHALRILEYEYGCFENINNKDKYFNCSGIPNFECCYNESLCNQNLTVSTLEDTLVCRCVNSTHGRCALEDTCYVHAMLGICYKEAVMDESGSVSMMSGCLEQGIDKTAQCNQTSDFTCCSRGDYCNDYLVASVPMESTSTPVQTEQASASSPASASSQVNTGLVVAIVVPSAVTMLLLALSLCLILCLLRRRKLRQETSRRVAGAGMMEMKSSGELDLIDMTVTSGSGSGLPFLIQRTVARTITVTEAIGNGRYGQVFLGYYQGEPVAVKKFASRDEKSWVRETEIFNTLLLRHDNILGFFASDMVSNNGVTELWLITQYHQFGSLYDFLNQEAVSPKVMLQMTISTCSGLAHLHTELYGTQAKPAIAHRDIKSKNILVKNNMTCCIADFGLAVFKDHNEMNMPTNPKQGTKRYMAPEILNETINMRSFESFKQVDVYALGLVLWEICRRCTGTTGVPEEYEVPFQALVPPDPSFEDMRRVVAVERRQPAIPSRWSSEELLREMTKVMRECWYYTSTARPTAVYLKKKLLKMSHELEKMNYIEHDVCRST